eukprot:scaffold307_cov390-Prasinococcus_capsulatus_cf.AAC.32
MGRYSRTWDFEHSARSCTVWASPAPLPSLALRANSRKMAASFLERNAPSLMMEPEMTKSLRRRNASTDEPTLATP